MHFAVQFRDETFKGEFLKDGGDGWNKMPDKPIQRLAWLTPFGDTLVLQGYDQYCYRIECAQPMGCPFHVLHVLLMGARGDVLWKYEVAVLQKPNLELKANTPVHYITNLYRETLPVFKDYGVKVRDIAKVDGKIKFLTDPRGNPVYAQEPDYHKWKRSLLMDTDGLSTFCAIRGVRLIDFMRSLRCTMNAAAMRKTGDISLSVCGWDEEDNVNPTRVGWKPGTSKEVSSENNQIT